MAQTMPNIEVIFKQKAVTAIQRSERGIVCIVVNDATNAENKVVKYNYSSDVKEEDYTADNYKAIVAAFLGIPNSVYVVKLGSDETFEDAADSLKSINFNWLCYLSETAEEQGKVAAYVKERNNANNRHKIKCVCYKATVTNDIHVLNFTNNAVTFAEEGAEYPVAFYVARLCGVFAGMPFTRSATYTVLQELSSVEEPEDLNAAVGDGELILFNDVDEVRIARAITSLTEVDADHTEDMQKVTIVEAMDMILEDIVTTFNDYYCGKYKNSYDNQVLFISAVNAYFKTLAGESVLDPNYENTAFVDTEKQRNDWLGVGKVEAAEWDELTIKNMTFKSLVNLAGNIKVLDAMEDLKFAITMA